MSKKEKTVKKQVKENSSPLQTEKHKCTDCWCGTWHGNKYYCMMPNCIKT